MFASQTVTMAKGSGDSCSWAASESTTGVSSTAVVSRPSRTVVSGREGGDQQEQHGRAAARQVSGLAGGDVEDHRDLGELREHGDGDEKQQDRRHPPGDVGRLVPGQQAGGHDDDGGERGEAPHVVP